MKNMHDDNIIIYSSVLLWFGGVLLLLLLLSVSSLSVSNTSIRFGRFVEHCVFLRFIEEEGHVGRSNRIVDHIDQ
jgi:hypothetical protein